MSPRRTTEPCPPAFIDLAERLADASGPLIRSHFRTGVDIERKSDATPVTVADRGAEEAMRTMIEAEHPDHGILGEEYGTVRGDAPYLWVLDPVDGTKSFISGIPLFGTLIALLLNGAPILGIVDQPVLGERWVGAAGRPTTLNGLPVRTRRCPDIGRAALYSTAPEMFRGADAAAHRRLAAAVGMVRYGADCYAAAMLASGHVDLVVEAGLAPYDFCALVPIVEKAGGVASDWSGAPLDRDSDGRVVFAGDPELHEQAIVLLSAS